MEYQVPQFIEVEDKIFGPLTLKQFVFLAGGIGLCVVILLYLPLFFGLLLALPIAIFSGALAFYKINNKNFLDIIQAAIGYYMKDRLYLWKKEPKARDEKPLAPEKVETRQKLGLSGGKLKDLAWSLDIQDHNAPPTD